MSKTNSLQRQSLPHQRYRKLHPNSTKASYLRNYEPTLESLLEVPAIQELLLKADGLESLAQILSHSVAGNMGIEPVHIKFVRASERCLPLVRHELANTDRVSFNTLFAENANPPETFRPYFSGCTHVDFESYDRPAMYLGHSGKPKDLATFTVMVNQFPSNGSTYTIEDFFMVFCIYPSGFLRWAKDLDIRQSKNDISKHPSSHYMKNFHHWVIVRGVDIAPEYGIVFQ